MSNRTIVPVCTFYQRVSNLKNNEHVPLYSIKPILLNFKIVSLLRMKYLLTEGLFWGIGIFISLYISPMKKALKFFFCSEDSRNLVLQIIRGSRALLPYTCVWIYGWYKENLQQESFCKSVLHGSINRRLALLSSSVLLRPSISLSLKTAMEVWSLVCHHCLPPPPPAFMFSTSP